MLNVNAAYLAVFAICFAGTVHAEGDAAAGEKVFRKCKACHMVGDDAKNRVGPVLTGIIDEPIASNPDFKYSEVFLEKKDEGYVWTVEELDLYLEKPRDHIKGNKMAFVGLKKPEDRADVIAYLATFE